ncbi:GAF domain-containing sensor histidine kinase [Streptomyces natalensis]|uniref:Histidine kinase n=1 Tax=Streptomyces natalensis ATCC 27448 TaxID=1240678 RepID=A0A0D7CL19_9ACTN|nr:GAF domain-containing protein [Streptomyces natalensis]KIZ16152.1 histidine kinase [Streptomyces natalensis ATCC 27448]
MGDEEAGRAKEPRQHLDALPDDLLERLRTLAGGTGPSPHLLLEAVLSVGQGLELPQVLRRIVEAATVLVDAEYGALGLIREGTRIGQFLPVGVTQRQMDAIGGLPEGHGILGELIRHPTPLRLNELGEHPASYGFPPHHPPMHSFLGVPIKVRGEVFGNLYLTEKRGGHFDADDETVLATLAVAAGAAIEHARLYEEARNRQRWLEANGEIVAGLLPGADEADVLPMIVGHAVRLLSADLGVLAQPAEGEHLRVELAVGEGAEAHRGLDLPRHGSFMGATLTAKTLLISHDVEHDPRVTAGPPRWTGLGPAVAVPMIAGEQVRGVLLLARRRGREPFTASETAPLLTFAGQAALAMELAERRAAAERLTLLTERERIARDLHDLAIQRLFATGMTLQSAVRFVDHPEATERLWRAVDDLDETIKIIRSTIFGLRAHDTARGRHSLRVRTVTTVDQASHALGFSPALHMEGLVDTDVPPEIAEHALAVLGEALSNTARHARASAAEVAMVVGDRRLTLTVRDNGVGIARGGRRSGLSNLAKRAESVGGELSVEPLPEGGTRLVWSVPLPA